MSDDESSQSEAESEEEKPKTPIKKESSETELAMKKRREAQEHATTGLDETAKDLLESNKQERDRMEEEIQELRLRNESRKKKREIEEKRLAAERASEDERRKSAEEAKKRQKVEEEEKRNKERAKKMAEFEKWKNPPKPNFVIGKRSGSADDEEEEVDPSQYEEVKGRKSKEQLEMEKRAILKQRLIPCELQGLDANKMKEKATEMVSLIYRLEGEKYDLEKQFKAQQFDMMELAEKARKAIKVGKGGLKRIQQGPDENVDKIQQRFAGTPAKIEMYSKYERQKDKRAYDERLKIYTGPQFVYPAEKIKPQKVIRWTEEGLPIYDPAENSESGEAKVNGDVNGE